MLVIDDRAVAFIDILGFEEIVRTQDLNKLAQRLELALVDCVGLAVVHAELANSKGVQKVAWDKRVCGYFQFSDAILLYSFNGSYSSCVNLIVSAWHLLRSLFAAQLPSRGAVSFGRLAVDVKNALFVGQPVIEAYRLAQAQDWCGAIVGPSVEAAFPNLAADAANPKMLLSAVLYPYKVPFKSAAASTIDAGREHLCLNWRFNLYVQAGTQFLFPQSDDPGARAKIENTLKFCKVLRDRNRVWAHDANLPNALKSFGVGDRQNAPHGDEY